MADDSPDREASTLLGWGVILLLAPGLWFGLAVVANEIRVRTDPGIVAPPTVQAISNPFHF
jgi:hypothetical protein